MSYKVVPHLDHADMLEVAVYRKDHPFDKEPISSITVECTKCGEVVEEVYSIDDDNTDPLDCEFPAAETPTALDMLEELLSITEQFKDLMDPEYRDRWLAISAREADLRNGTNV